MLYEVITHLDNTLSSPRLTTWARESADRRALELVAQKQNLATDRVDVFAAEGPESKVDDIADPFRRKGGIFEHQNASVVRLGFSDGIDGGADGDLVHLLDIADIGDLVSGFYAPYFCDP